MSGAYQPRGIVLILLPRLDAEPTRIFSHSECARIMGCKPSAVSATLLYAVKARRIFKRNTGTCCEYSATEMAGSVVLPPSRKRTKHPEVATPIEQGWLTDPNDPRIGKVVPDWKPPVMRHVRGGA